MQRTIIELDIPSDVDESDMESNYTIDEAQVWEPSSDVSRFTTLTQKTPNLHPPVGSRPRVPPGFELQHLYRSYPTNNETMYRESLVDTFRNPRGGVAGLGATDPYIEYQIKGHNLGHPSSFVPPPFLNYQNATYMADNNIHMSPTNFINEFHNFLFTEESNLVLTSSVYLQEEFQTNDRDNTPVPDWDDPEMYDILEEISESDTSTETDMDIPGSSNSEQENASLMEDGAASGDESMLYTDEETDDAEEEAEAEEAIDPVVASNNEPQNPPQVVEQIQVLPVDLRANPSAEGATGPENAISGDFGSLNFEIYEVVNKLEVLLILNDINE